MPGYGPHQWLPSKPMAWLALIVVVAGLAFFVVAPALGYSPGLGCATWAGRLSEAEQAILEAQLDDIEVPKELFERRTRARAVLALRCQPQPTEDDRMAAR